MKNSKGHSYLQKWRQALFSNYRPVSLLPQFLEILEKLIVQRLDHFIEKHNLSSDHQYGFRSNRSTAMSMMEMKKEISTAKENKEYTVGVV